MMKTFLTIAFSWFLCFGFAQDKNMKDRELVVQKEYNSSIYDVDPIFDFSSISLKPKAPLNFTEDSLSTISFLTPDIDISIKPVTYKTIADKSIHSGFLKLDKGLTNPIHAQGGYTLSANNYYNLTGRVDYDHRAQKENTDQYIKRLNVGVDMDYYLTKEIKIDLGIAYKNHSFGLYGSREILGNEDIGGQSGFQNIQAQIGIRTFKTLPSKWNFGLLTTLNDWRDKLEIGRERNIYTQGWAELQLDDKWSIDLRPDYNTSLSSAYNDAYILGGSLTIGFDADLFYLAPGLRLDYFDNSLNLWPDVDLRWKITKFTEIDLRSSVDSKILGAQQLSRENAYINFKDLTTQQKEIRYNRNLGLKVKSTINEDTEITLNAIYSKINNDLNYRLSPEDIRLFKPVSVDYERLRLMLTVDRSIWEQLLVAGLSLQYDKYAEQTSPLLYRPTLTVRPRLVSSLLEDKLVMELSGMISNPQNLEFIPMTNIVAGWRKNISFSFRLAVMDQLTVNFNADNIFDDEYDVWNGYSNFGRNLSGGFIFKF